MLFKGGGWYCREKFDQTTVIGGYGDSQSYYELPSAEIECQAPSDEILHNLIPAGFYMWCAFD